MERSDIGKVPVETAARDTERLRQRIGLERGESRLGQRLEAGVHPISGSQTIVAHGSIQ